MFIGILPPASMADLNMGRDPTSSRKSDVLELADLIRQLQIPPTDVLPAAEFVDFDLTVPTIEPMTDEEIISSVTQRPPKPDQIEQTDPSDSEENVDDIEPPKVSSSQAISALRTAATFFEDNVQSTEEDLDAVNSLIKRVLTMKPTLASQSSITDYFSSTTH